VKKYMLITIGVLLVIFYAVGCKTADNQTATPTLVEKEETQAPTDAPTQKTEPTLPESDHPYVKVIDDFISNCRREGFDSVYADGILYDLDSNGVDELIIINTDFDADPTSATDCSVYTIKGDKLYCILDEKQLVLRVGSSSGKVSVVRKDNSIYLKIFTDGGNDDGSLYRDDYYRLENDELVLIHSAEANYRYDDKQSYAYVDGQTTSCDYYESFADGFDKLVLKDDSFSSEEETIFDLREKIIKSN